ncbi:hypothetical protein COB28_02325 [Candidatus Dependentiae bacterium]|nr:MAG: hypothetical protein COB28_02325 [Candidatus Dependentiae bacterium]
MFLIHKKVRLIGFLFFLLADNKIVARNLIQLIKAPSCMTGLKKKSDDQGKNDLAKAYVVTKYLKAGDAVGPVYQLVMEFKNQINCEKECDIDGSKIKLYFSGMKSEDLERVGFKKECEKISFVKKVDIFEETEPIKRLAVVLSFEAGSAVVKIQKRANPHILTIDCYEKSILTSIKNLTDVYRMA